MATRILTLSVFERYKILRVSALFRSMRRSNSLTKYKINVPNDVDVAEAEILSLLGDSSYYWERYHEAIVVRRG